MDPTGIDALRAAKDILGSENAVAVAAGVKQPSVNYILNTGQKVPAEWCIPVERAVAAKIAETGKGDPITKEQLRPDLWGPGANDPTQQAVA